MSRLPSTSSTELPGTSSAGRFDLDCATPYSRNLWDDETTQEDWTLEIECTPGQVFIFHGEELRAPNVGTGEDKLALALRHVCHLFVDRIDNRGLQDVCQSLAEFYQYYRPTEESRKLLPDSRTRDATVGARTVSSAFVIEEE